MNTWADGTPRSQRNAFDWRNTASSIANSKDWKQSEASKRSVKPGKPITLYTRAKPKK